MEGGEILVNCVSRAVLLEDVGVQVGEMACAHAWLSLQGRCLGHKPVKRQDCVTRQSRRVQALG